MESCDYLIIPKKHLCVLWRNFWCLFVSKIALCTQNRTQEFLGTKLDTYCYYFAFTWLTFKKRRWAFSFVKIGREVFHMNKHSQLKIRGPTKWRWTTSTGSRASCSPIMEQMKATEGVTAELKCTCQMEWVQRYNNIHNRAEEIDLHVMVYS